MRLESTGSGLPEWRGQTSLGIAWVEVYLPYSWPDGTMEGSGVLEGNCYEFGRTTNNTPASNHLRHQTTTTCNAYRALVQPSEWRREDGRKDNEALHHRPRMLPKWNYRPPPPLHLAYPLLVDKQSRTSDRRDDGLLCLPRHHHPKRVSGAINHHVTLLDLSLS